MKDNSKRSEILSAVIVTVVYLIISIAIIVKSKWTCVLILLTAMLMLCLLWKERMNILKLWAIIMLIYSVMALAGWNGVDLTEKSNKNPMVLMILFVVEMFVQHSGKIITFILALGIIFVKPIVKHIRIVLMNAIYGPLPEVRRIVKRHRKVYLYHDYHTKQMQVIFRNGRKKKILDAYESKGIPSSEEHYSLEWEKEDELIVRKYNVYTHNIIMEKDYKVPKY